MTEEIIVCRGTTESDDFIFVCVLASCYWHIHLGLAPKNQKIVRWHYK